MLDLVARSLVERYAASALGARDFSYDEPINLPPVPKVAVALIICTMLVWLGLYILVDYTMLSVVATLAIVEEVPRPADLADEVNEPLIDPAFPLSTPGRPVSTAPGTVTSGVCNAIRHLRAEAGWFSMFRGFWYLFAYGFFEGFINGLVTGILRPFLSVAVYFVIPIFTPVLLWRFNNVWLHKVISKPSQKSWLVRFREQKGSLAVKRAILLWAFCRSIASFIPWVLLYHLVLRTFETVNGDIRFNGSAPQTFLELFGIFALMLVLSLLLVVPTTIILIRIQASMLPANDEGIVLLDKALCKSVSFESPEENAASEPIAGDSKLTLLSAWRSFAYPARIRVLKVYAKCYAIQIVLFVVYIIVINVVCMATISPQAVFAVMARAI